MGCDIHFFVEKKAKAYTRQKSLNNVLEIDKEVPDVWESVDDWIVEEEDGNTYRYVNYDTSYYNGRNYQLFGVLAGVRHQPNDQYPFIEPRGIPDDVSKPIQDSYEEWDIDAHTPSYLTLSELKQIDWTMYTDSDYNWFAGFENTIDRMDELSNNDEDVRCVFWFDN
jgi:hypothetical protein